MIFCKWEENQELAGEGNDREDRDLRRIRGCHVHGLTPQDGWNHCEHGLLKTESDQWGGTALWKSACLACMRPWVAFPATHAGTGTHAHTHACTHVCTLRRREGEESKVRCGELEIHVAELPSAVGRGLWSACSAKVTPHHC